LIVAVHVTFAQGFPLNVCEPIKRRRRKLHGGCAEALREIRRRAYQHHRLDPAGVHGSQMKKGFRAHTHPNRLDARDSKMIKKAGDILGASPKGKFLWRTRRTSVSAQIRHDKAVAAWV